MNNQNQINTTDIFTEIEFNDDILEQLYELKYIDTNEKYKLTFINIPENYKYNGINYKITKISELAFFNCTSLETVIIPNSVTYIGKWSFSNCKSLQNINIPNNVTYIGERAFKNCSSLETVILPNGVTYIGKLAFSDCISLKNVNIPNNISKLDEKIFYSCSSLKKIIIPQNVRYIEKEIFFKCTSLEEIIINNSFKNVKISKTAFEKFQKIVFTQDIKENTNIKKNEAILTEKETKYVEIELNDHYFKKLYEAKYVKNRYKYDLKAINIPATFKQKGINYKITSIGNRMFSWCSKLKTVVIPNTVKIIEEQAFSNCISLEEIIIPNSVQKISELAFANCNFLDKIVILNNSKDIQIAHNSFDYPENITFSENAEYPKNQIEENTIITDETESISNENTFIDISLTDEILQQLYELKYIKTNNKYKLIDLDIPEVYTYNNKNYKIINIPKAQFYDCDKLKKVNIPNSVSVISKKAFTNCTSLEYVKLPKNITNINSKTFDNCINLKEIEIPKNVKTINQFAFCNCTQLKTVKIDNNPKDINIAENAFDENVNIFFTKQEITENKNTLKEIELNDEVFKILKKHKYIKNSKNNLISIEIPGSFKYRGIKYKITKIAKNLFSNCTKLKNIILPNCIDTIGKKAFYNCYSLKNINIPYNVKKINARTFGNCNELKEIILNNVKYNLEIEDTAFDDITKINFIEKINQNTTLEEEYIKTELNEETFKTLQKLKYIPNWDKKFITEIEIPEIYLNNGKKYKITSVGERVFKWWTNLKKVKLPNSITDIKEEAFFFCTSLIEIILSKNLINIGKRAFSCTSLKKIEFPDNIETIDCRAFSSCHNLKELKFPTNVTIKEEAFLYCTKLEKLILPNNNKIKPRAFSWCINLHDIIIPNNVMILPNGLFKSCKSLQKIIIPPNIKYIGYSTFRECWNLEKIIIQNSKNNILINDDSFKIPNNIIFTEDHEEESDEEI